MTTYEISFDFDFSEIEYEVDNNELDVEIEYIDTDSFIEDFLTPQGIKNFEEWYNVDDEDIISIDDIDYDSDDKGGLIRITLENELKDPQAFAEELLEYIYDEGNPTVELHYSGFVWNMGWDSIGQGPSEYKQSVDDSDWKDLNKYTNIKIKKTS